MYRVLSNLKKKKPGGFVIVDGNLFKLCLEDFQLLGFLLLLLLRKERRNKILTYIPYNML